jgi:hypothetical protein
MVLGGELSQIRGVSYGVFTSLDCALARFSCRNNLKSQLEAGKKAAEGLFC